MIDKIIEKIQKQISYQFNVVYSLNDKHVRLVCDEFGFCDYASDRLGKHFLIETRVKSSDVVVYACKADEYCKSICRILVQKSEWNITEHMNGYYYNTRIEEYGVTLWDNNGNRNSKLGEIVERVFSKDNNISILISASKEYYFFYYDCNEHTKPTPMRIIRSLLMYDLVDRYDAITYFHTAVIRYRNKGILLCGASGNGKTSTVLNFIKEGEGELVANDKAFLCIDHNGQLVSFGWPTVVTIGVGNLKQYKELEKFLVTIEDVKSSQQLYGSEPNKKYLLLNNDEMIYLPKKCNKLVISHSLLSELFDINVVPKTQVDVIIFVNHHWDFGDSIVAKITEDKKKIIEENLLENISDQLNWIGCEECKAKNVNEIVSYIENEIDIYNYEADFKLINLKKVLDEVLL